MYDIIKEKNLLKFVLNEKTYCLNLNTGDLLGMCGNPLKNTPAHLQKCLETNYKKNTITTAIYFFHKYYNVPLHDMKKILNEIRTFDVLDSIGYKLSCNDLYANRSRIKFVQKHLKVFSKAFKENPETTLNSFYEDYYIELKCKDYNITVDDHFTTEMARSLIAHADTFSLEQIKWIKYYMQRGLYTFLEDKIYLLFNKMREYFSYCEFLNMKPLKTDFLRAYAEVKNAYLINKKEYDNKTLQKNQEQYKNALFFEDENFITVIPTTKEAFENEAKTQNNCVARLYLPKVIEGTTNIIFIRKKENIDNSFITCEVKEGKIMQFLKSYNRTPSDKDSIDFKEKYQDHLTKNWK